MQAETLPELFKILDQDIAEYDCGQLCRDSAGNPYCCNAENFIPLLYKVEAAYLNQKAAAWTPWQPRTDLDRRLLENLKEQTFCICNFKSCQRDLRSLNCRTYPLEPYLSPAGEYSALTFIAGSTENKPDSGTVRCPMTKRAQDIRQDFINSVFLFYKKLFAIRPEEKQVYNLSSARLRSLCRETGQQLVLFYPATT